jgi:hypothetical protein
MGSLIDGTDTSQHIYCHYIRKGEIADDDQDQAGGIQPGVPREVSWDMSWLHGFAAE